MSKKKSKTGVRLERNGKMVKAETEIVPTPVVDTFVPSNAAAIKEAFDKCKGHSKRHFKEAQADLHTFTILAFDMATEYKNASQFTTDVILKAAIYRVSNADYDSLSGSEYDYLSQTILKAVSAAVLLLTTPGFRLGSDGHLQCMGKVAKPMISDKDAFGNVIPGSKVPNDDAEFGDVPVASYRKHYGVAFPGSVATRGTKKDGVKEQEASAASADQVYADLAHSIADGTLPKSKSALQLIIAVYTSGITKEDAMDALDGIETEPNPTDVANLMINTFAA